MTTLTCLYCEGPVANKTHQLCAMHNARRMRGTDMHRPKQNYTVTKKVRAQRRAELVAEETENLKQAQKRRRQAKFKESASPWRADQLPIAVVAHRSRIAAANALASRAESQTIVWDTARHGAARNHAEAWRWLGKEADPNQYAVVLEDDAVLTSMFRRDLAKALAVAPAPIIGLHLGRGYPQAAQLPISDALLAATDKTSWLVGTELYATTAYAMPVELFSVLARTHPRYHEPIATHISAWAQRGGHRIAYCWPSLVDRRTDLTPLREQPPARRGWGVGSRSAWTRDAVILPTPQEAAL